MDYRFSFQRPMRRSSFGSMKGTIVDLVPAGWTQSRWMPFVRYNRGYGRQHGELFHQPGYVCGGFHYTVGGNDGNLLVSQ